MDKVQSDDCNIASATQIWLSLMTSPIIMASSKAKASVKERSSIVLDSGSFFAANLLDPRFQGKLLSPSQKRQAIQFIEDQLTMRFPGQSGDSLLHQPKSYVKVLLKSCLMTFRRHLIGKGLPFKPLGYQRLHPKNFCILSFLLKKCPQSLHCSDTKNACMAELTKFIGEGIPLAYNEGTNPTHWWKACASLGHHLPELVSLACMFMECIASSAGLERCFSTTKWVQSKLRNQDCLACPFQKRHSCFECTNR